MTRKLHISGLRQHALRNLRPTLLGFGPQLNIFWGDNGQGKTSILEALVLATTSRSFRTDQIRDLIQHGETSATVQVTIEEAGLTRHQRVDLAKGRKLALLDGKRVQKTADFAVKTPVVVFHPADLNLVSGPASLRRTLLARLALYMNPVSFDSNRAYLLAMRERQRLLLDRGPSAPELDAFEQIAADHGSVVTAAFALAAQQLTQALVPILTELAPSTLHLELRHVASGTTDANQFRRVLKDDRQRDQLRGRASFGPQRDDLQLRLDGGEARRHASQGQQRLLALAMKLAELASIRGIRQVHPVLLLDDVSSELDPRRTGALFDWLRGIQSQVFITTTRLDIPNFTSNPEIPPHKFRVRGGVAEQESS